MNRIVVVVSKSKVLQREIAEGLAKESQGDDLVIVVVDHLDNVKRRLENLEPAFSRISRIVVVNTDCSNPMDDVLGFPQVINFCLYPKPEHRAIAIKPYVSLAEILVVRIESLSAGTKKLEVSISIPKKDLELMAQLHNLTFAQVLRILSEHLKSIGVAQGYVLSTDNAVATISVEWKGLIRGYEKDRVVNFKLVHSSAQGFSSYAWQIMAFVSLFINVLPQPVESADVVPMLGSSEGLYAYFLSKLVEYGGEYRIEIS